MQINLLNTQLSTSPAVIIILKAAGEWQAVHCVSVCNNVFFLFYLLILCIVKYVKILYMVHSYIIYSLYLYNESYNLD